VIIDERWGQKSEAEMALIARVKGQLSSFQQINYQRVSEREKIVPFLIII
jgi:hypothetical protein